MNVIALLVTLTPDAHACGGMYVPPTSQTGEALYSQSSHVVIARSSDGEHHVTIAADVIGDVDDFAFVLPVPELLEEDDLGVADDGLVASIAVYDGPRSVAMTCSDFRPDTEEACPQDYSNYTGGGGSLGSSGDGVAVEGSYLVGDFQVTILSATESGALSDWLGDNGYAVPVAARGVLAEYIDAGMYFLAAQVAADSGLSDGDVLPSLRFRLSDAPTTLPLRLGASVAESTQDVVVHIIHQGAFDPWGISNIAEVTVETECMLPEGVTLAEQHAQAIADAHSAAGEAIWLLEYDAELGDIYEGLADVGIWPWDLELEQLGLAPESDQRNLSFQRLHVRYDPDELTVDPALYERSSVGSSEIRYVDYLYELEGYLPVCGLGMVDGGTCPPTEVLGEPCEDEEKGCGGCATGVRSSGWSRAAWIWLGLVGLVARRRTR